MHDPLRDIWRGAMARLPAPETLMFHPKRNLDREALSCIICDRGSGYDEVPPEWLVTMHSHNATITKGLHETCRMRHTGSRHGKAMTMNWFGTPWESPVCDASRQVTVPPGTQCAECDQSISPQDQGFVLGSDTYHKKCFLQATAEAGIV